MGKENNLVFVGRDGWPVELIKGKPIVNFIRRIIHTKRIIRYGTWRKEGGCSIEFN